MNVDSGGERDGSTRFTDGSSRFMIDDGSNLSVDRVALERNARVAPRERFTSALRISLVMQPSSGEPPLQSAD